MNLSNGMLIQNVNELARVIYSPEHWRGRAEEMRILAAATTDPAAKSMLLLIGDAFETLSERAAERLHQFPRELSRQNGSGDTDRDSSNSNQI